MSFNFYSDRFIDKFVSLPAKMKDNTFTQGSSLCLMSKCSPNLFNHTEEELLNNFFHSGVSAHIDYNSAQRMKSESFLRILGSNFLGSNIFTSPYLSNFVQDTVRYLNARSDLLLSPNSLNIHKMFSKFILDPQLMKRTYLNHKIDSNDKQLNKINFVDKEFNITSVEEHQIQSVEKQPNIISVQEHQIHSIDKQPNISVPDHQINLIDKQSNISLPENTSNCVHKQVDVVSVQDHTIAMSVTVENRMPKGKCDVPNGVTLNLELISRKTKELQKRSKRRRRRQKNVKHSSVKSSNSNSEDEIDSSCKTSPISSHMCSSSSLNEEPGFVVQVEHKVAPNLISSFFISVENISDDSDWDSCSENNILTDTEEFELTGLVLTNLNPPRVCTTPYSFNVKMNVTDCQEDEEACKYQAALLEVNKKWNRSTKGVSGEPKSSPKVSFAPDDKLVEIFPVEICERKGEWEVYANERLRFKRRIDELAKVISPCLAAEHRQNIYRKVIKPLL